MQRSSINGDNLIRTKAARRRHRDILLIETPLEGHLVRVERRRSFLPALSALVKDLTVDATVYHETVNTVEDLCAVLDRCADQNRRTRPTSTAERTRIRFIHIVSHGDKHGFLLRNADGSELAPEQLGAEFRRVKDANIRAVFLSSCKSARGRRMATSITQTAGIPYVIGYMNNAYDSRCCLADQLFYYQVLFARPRAPIETIVRRVNDALFLAGEKPERMLGCWHFNGERVLGPSPWWAEEWAHLKSPEARSLLAMMVRHARRPQGPGPSRYLRTLVESLRD
jgi:hypothetical protein